jgi:hypothetical protein
MERTENRVQVLNDARTCSNCRHMYRRVLSIEASVSECRLNPPTPVAAVIPGPNGPQWVANGFYPQVDPPTDWWCSKFEPKLQG